MAKKSKKSKNAQDAGTDGAGPPAPPGSPPDGSAAAGTDAAAPKMKRKEYEAELRTLHGELVAMQEWVKATGAKICIVFEGRDTAGKGGTIKRDHRAGEPAGVPGRRAARADRAREVADVRAALHAALPGGR